VIRERSRRYVKVPIVCSRRSERAAGNTDSVPVARTHRWHSVRTAFQRQHRPVVIAASGKLRVGDGGVGVTSSRTAGPSSVKVGVSGEPLNTGASFTPVMLTVVLAVAVAENRHRASCTVSDTAASIRCVDYTSGMTASRQRARARVTLRDGNRQPPTVKHHGGGMTRRCPPPHRHCRLLPRWSGSPA